MKSNTYTNPCLDNLVHVATKSASNVLERLSSYKNFTLNAKQNSFKLPKPSKYEDIQSDIALKHLRNQGFTDGLVAAIARNNSVFPLRIWIVDNSGSMNQSDGHRILPTNDKQDVKLISCTRWDEIKDTVSYHAQTAAILKAPTVFRLLNHPGAIVGSQQFGIAEDSDLDEDIAKDIQNTNLIMSKSHPDGVTHLIPHILEIQRFVKSITPQLREECKRVTIVISTDGLPTDEYGSHDKNILQQFIASLRLMEGLPVWVVVRLCTDDNEVVKFYNNLDEELEFSLEVLDHFTKEAAEVYEKNPWLNYALPLHRCREMGFYNCVFDLLDERALSRGELLNFLALLFGEGKLEGIAHPNKDWKGFTKFLTRLVESESKQLNPIKKKMSRWIDMKELNKIYGYEKLCIY